MISTLTIKMVALVRYVVINMHDLIIYIVASKGGTPFHPKGVLIKVYIILKSFQGSIIHQLESQLCPWHEILVSPMK